MVGAAVLSAVVLWAAGCTEGTALAPPPPPDASPSRLLVRPIDTTAVVGQTVQFSALLEGLGGRQTPTTAVWAVGGAGRARISAGGSFVADTAGAYTVLGRVDSLTAQATVVVADAAPAPVVQLSIRPDSLTVSPGAQVSFVADGRRADGSTTQPVVTWSASGGTITAEGAYTAPAAAGTFRVFAALGGTPVIDTAVVVVNQPTALLTSLTIEPRSVSVERGQTQVFAARARWSDGSSTTPPVEWTATGGTISTAGSYRAGNTSGTFRAVVRDPVRGFADTATITIRVPTPTGISISPRDARVAFGAQQSFAALVTRSDGSTTSSGVTWTATGGTISSAGVFTAGQVPGPFRVVARTTVATVADSVAVVVEESPVVSCSVAPATATLAPGQQQQFTVSGERADGSLATVTAAWSAQGGTITTNGRYTAGTMAGSYRIIATLAGSASISCAADVNVAPPTLTRISVSPRTPTLAPGGTQQFSVSGTLSDGNTTPVTVSWSASAGGGTVSPNGAYVAPSTSGTFRVFATSTENPQLLDTATVTVQASATPPPAANLNPDLSTNVPAGMTLVTDWDMQRFDFSPPLSDWTVWRDPATQVNWKLALNRPGAQCSGAADVAPSIIDDPTAPSGNGRVISISYQGVPEGHEPKFPFFEIPTRLQNNRLFVSMLVKFQPTWRMYGGASSPGVQGDDDRLSGIKWHVLQNQGGGFGGYIGLSGWFADVTGGDPTVRFDFVQNTFTGNVPADRRQETSPPGVFTRGQWYKLQYEVTKRQTSNTSRVRMWINDALVLDKSDFAFTSTAGISAVELAATRGGGSGWPACNTMSGQVLVYDRIAAWTGP